MSRQWWANSSSLAIKGTCNKCTVLCQTTNRCQRSALVGFRHRERKRTVILAYAPPVVALLTVHYLQSASAVRICWHAIFFFSCLYLYCIPLPVPPSLSHHEEFAERRCSAEGQWEGKPGSPPTLHGWTNYTPCYSPEVIQLFRKLYASGSDDEANVRTGHISFAQLPRHHHHHHGLSCYY